ncbi:glycoside hydrolase 61 [Diaporthe eres]
MSSVAVKALAAIVAGATSVAAHGHVTGINVAGTWYEGYDPTSFPYMSDPPTVVGWTASDTDNGFVAPDAYASGDIICHKSATNAKGYATAKAGDTIEVYWNTWPTSHKGPVIDYLAKCAGDDCVTADKTALEFFKIDAVGLADASADTWGSDQLVSNNNSWTLQIPSTLATGNYVLRHEIIALHSAESADGAQNYPQCFNLAITGTGSLQPSGTLGEALYKESDAGILVNIYNSLTSYDIPGPTQIAAGTNLAQSAVPITASASAVTSLSGASGAAAATTSAAQATPTGQAAASGAASQTPSAVAPTGSAAAAQTSSASAAATSAAKSCKKRRHARDVARA